MFKVDFVEDADQAEKYAQFILKYYRPTVMFSSAKPDKTVYSKRIYIVISDTNRFTPEFESGDPISIIEIKTSQRKFLVSNVIVVEEFAEILKDAMSFVIESVASMWRYSYITIPPKKGENVNAKVKVGSADSVAQKLASLPSDTFDISSIPNKE